MVITSLVTSHIHLTTLVAQLVATLPREPKVLGLIPRGFMVTCLGVSMDLPKYVDHLGTMGDGRV